MARTKLFLYFYAAVDQITWGEIFIQSQVEGVSNDIRSEIIDNDYQCLKKIANLLIKRIRGIAKTQKKA